MDALDPAQLDVRGRGRTGDERQRAALALDELVEPRERSGDAVDDLLLADDADVQIGEEREDAPSLRRPGGEHERACLGDRQRAAGDDAVDAVEVEVRAAMTLYTFPFNALGWPALALGGVQVVGRPGSDPVVLGAGAALEAALKA